jgi:hypothetical protein
MSTANFKHDLLAQFTRVVKAMGYANRLKYQKGYQAPSG